MVRYLAMLALGGALWSQSGGGKYQAGPLPSGQGSKPSKSHPRVPSTGQIQKLQTACQARYSVGSEAIFERNRLELVQGGGQVLTELGNIVRRETQHPISVEGYSQSRSSIEQEASYVERWLVERGFLNPHVARVKAFETVKPENRIEVVVDTCK